jgi:uncharacterized protein YkwD
VHHAPAGPRLSARLAGLLAPLVSLLRLLRRTRVLPVTLAAIALGAFALAAPIAPYDDDARSTAALTAGAEDGLVPATGGGWTQDGVPAPSSADDEPVASSSASSAASSSASESSSASSPASDDASPAGIAASSASSADTSSSAPGTSGTASSSPRLPAVATDRSPEPVETSSSAPAGTPSAEAPVVDPADQVLALVNDARVAAGCPAMAADASLAALAAEHSAAMRDGGVVDVHVPGSTPLDRGGRTAVVASGTDPVVVGDGWAAETALLDCGLTAAGVGTTDGWWTLVAS